MKNYKFVIGLLLGGMLWHGAQAASLTPQTDANHAAVAPTGGGSVVFQPANVVQRPLALANHVGARRALAPAAAPIDNFMSYVNLRTAFHYLDGRADSVQGLRSQTKLAQQSAAVSDVTEPASEILLLAGLSALAIAIRRQSPS